MAKTTAPTEHLRINRLFSPVSDGAEPEPAIFTLSDFEHLRSCPACTREFARLLEQTMEDLCASTAC